MSTDSTKDDDIEQFLEDNPEFVETWLSQHGMEEIASQFSEYQIITKNVLKFYDVVSMYTDRTVLAEDVKSKTAEPLIKEMNLFRDILRLVYFDVDLNTVAQQILENVCILLHCHKTCLFLTQGTGKHRFLISKANSVSAKFKTDENYREEDAVFLPFGQGIDGFVAENKCLVNIKDVCRDRRFVRKGSERTEFQTKSVLSVPIYDKNKRVIGVAKAIDKCDADYFDSKDESILKSFSNICAMSIDNARLLEVCRRENMRHKMLLTLSRYILKYGTNLQKLVSEILQHAIEMLDCDNISISLVDKRGNSYQPTESMEVLQFLRGNTEVKNAPIDPRFIPFIEQNMNSASMVNVISLSNSINDTNTKTKIILEGGIQNWIICVSIIDGSKDVIGYMMFLRGTINTFNESDINMLKTFTIFCGLAIYNNYLYESCNKIIPMYDLTHDLLQTHSICDENYAHDMQQLDIKSTHYYKIYSYIFTSHLYSENEQILLTALMFLEMNVLNLLKIPKLILYRWILTVKNNYRPVTYHNWLHAINVTQTMFYILTTGKLQLYFTEFEQICLLIGCLFHDIDHRGTNNAFQVNTASPFATLYHTSIMENHHLNRSIMILKNKDTNIFLNVSAEKYQQGIKLIEKLILATDLVLYFERRNIFRQHIENGHTTFETHESIDLLLSMMATVADLSAITKPWDIHKMTTMLMADEFFRQGDMEREAGILVLPLMDRNKIYEIPQMQVGFIDFVCTMLYKTFSELHEELKPLYDGMLNNRAHWSAIVNDQEEFDVVKEYRQALEIHNSETMHEVMGSTIFPVVFHVNVGTQTLLTYLNLEQEQQIIQTILSYPITETVSVSDLTMPVSPETEMVSTETKGCQTENRSPNFSEANVQTYVPATRTGEELPAVPTLYRPQTSTSTRSRDYSESETGVSALSRASDIWRPIVGRRSSYFDELINERRRELNLEKRKSSKNKTNIEKPLRIKKSSHVILPPNPLRRENSLLRSTEYMPNNNSPNLQFSEKGSDEILFEESLRKNSSKYEISSKSPVEEKVLESVKNENIRRKSEDVASMPQSDTINESQIQLSSLRKQKLSWSKVYEDNKLESKLPVTRKSSSIIRDRKDSDYRLGSSLPKRITPGIEFRKRKCVKLLPKSVHKSKRMAFWGKGNCVIS